MTVRTFLNRIQEKRVAEDIVSKDRGLVLRGQNCGVVEFLPVEFVEGDQKLVFRYDSSLINLTSFFQELFWKGRYTEDTSRKMQAIIRCLGQTQGKNVHCLAKVLRSQKRIFDELALNN